ncbi:protein WEAK CHLOROPLAST MOVEMENT UNDER BLUE LIGHT 1-like [Phalaenopsis equestris]|uniref:Uncharacterized protein n=1 Tax=Phalaenopsis equestris TaxID=78828 RepID=A0A1S6YG20_PHAEQ|nr:protein WEAK CHLOROPLAST MOVEMENT UNDER BLUE LIGHT 1-like [Phalaenopsis equestris]AQX44220.1 hypothetical protein [Phalaenopsis equestris]
MEEIKDQQDSVSGEPLSSTSSSPDSNKESSVAPNGITKLMNPTRTLIDTAAPFQSVKAAVNMFGGNVDWKAQRAIAKERNRNWEQELEKAQQEVSICLKQLEAAEDAKTKVLQELEITKQQEEELTLQLEKAQIEESQAQQDSKLAQLRVKEIEQGIGKEDSVAAKEQLEVARARCLEAESELNSVRVELDSLKRECELLITEKDIAFKKAEEAEFASKTIERRVEELSVELINMKEAVESAQVLHLQVEQQRFNATMEKEQEAKNWEKEMKQLQEKLEFHEQILSVLNDVKLKFDTESALLISLKVELAAYVDVKHRQEAENVAEEKQNLAQLGSDEAVLTKAEKELEEVKAYIQKSKEEVKSLRIAVSSLKSELEKETSSLASLKQKENTSIMTISSHRSLQEKNQAEHEEVQAKQTRTPQGMRQFPQELLDRTEEADQAKSQAHFAHRELTKVMEEAELAKASASTMELRLQAVFKEIEAAKTSEKLSRDAIKAVENIHEVLTIPLEEYNALSKKANEAEKLANEKLIAAVDQIKAAKRTESMIRQKLEISFKEKKMKREALRDATEKAEKAKEGKLKMEQELREWRAENEQRRKASEADASSKGQPMNVRYFWKSFDDGRDINGTDPASSALRVNSTPNPNRSYSVNQGHVSVSVPEGRARKKKSIFPRIVMFLAAMKKARSSK